jgi:hypothetical protein
MSCSLSWDNQARIRLHADQQAGPPGHLIRWPREHKPVSVRGEFKANSIDPAYQTHHGFMVVVVGESHA